MYKVLQHRCTVRKSRRNKNIEWECAINKASTCNPSASTSESSSSSHVAFQHLSWLSFQFDNNFQCKPLDSTAKLRAATQPKGNAGGMGRGGDHSKCPRKGDAARIGGDNDIGDVDCDIPGCSDCSAGMGCSNTYVRPADADTVLAAAAAALDQSDGETEASGCADNETSVQGLPKRKRKGAKRSCGYTTKGEGPPLTKSAGELLGALLAKISLPDTHRDLDKFLDGLEQNTDDIDLQVSKMLEAVVKRLDAMQHKAHNNSFWYMVALVQLAMHVHSKKQRALNLHLHVPGAQAIAKEYNYSPTTFTRRLEIGT
ncbi:hypothetical protein K438DRAFT_1780388 [Mycena galopus ATCC 62051]|nr:hypothetical protein K438DRAFT_1780388 [Mycena galopus ATCC 62051]